MSSTTSSNIAVNPTDLRISSPQGPTAVEFHGEIHLAWTANDASHRIYIAKLNGSERSMEPTPLAPTSPFAPSLVEFEANRVKKMYMAWRADDPSNAIYLSSTTDGKRWAPSRRLDFTTLGEPVLAVHNAVLYLAWTANDPTHQLYIADSADGEYWSSARPIAGLLSRESPALVSTEDGLFVVAPEDPQGNRLFARSVDPPTRRTQLLEYYSRHRPAIVPYREGRSYLVCAEPESSRRIHVGFGTAENWGTHRITDVSSPSRVAAAVVDNELWLFWKEMGLSNSLYSARIECTGSTSST